MPVFAPPLHRGGRGDSAMKEHIESFTTPWTRASIEGQEE